MFAKYWIEYQNVNIDSEFMFKSEKSKIIKQKLQF